MKKIIKHQKSQKIICHRADMADTFFSRLIGLMFSKSLGDRDGLLFSPANSIHTFFMNYPIDLIFLNKQNKIVKIYRHLQPWRMTRLVWQASQAIELKSGTICAEVQEGDVLEVLDV